MTMQHSVELTVRVDAHEQFRAYPDVHVARDYYPQIQGHEQLLAWVDTRDAAIENGMRLLAVVPVLDSFHVENRVMRERDEGDTVVVDPRYISEAPLSADEYGRAADGSEVTLRNGVPVRNVGHSTGQR